MPSTLAQELFQQRTRTHRTHLTHGFDLVRRVHEASLFVVSKLGLEDQENNYGVKVAVKLFNKPFTGSTRESEIVKKIGKQKGFIRYKGYIRTPDQRLGTHRSRASCGHVRRVCRVVLCGD
jgi:hypothetical protein